MTRAAVRFFAGRRGRPPVEYRGEEVVLHPSAMAHETAYVFDSDGREYAALIRSDGDTLEVFAVV